MNDLLLVSVIIPTYNRAEPFLRKAIHSVISQTYSNWQLIIVDNNSIDNTDHVVKSFNDRRIKFLKIKNNGSIAKSRNLGILNSDGKYIAFLDSDDFWEKNKISECLKIFKNSNYKCICHGENWIYPNKKSRQAFYLPKYEFNYNNLLQYGNCISLSAVIIERDILQIVGFFSEDLNIITAEDYDLWLRIAKNKFKFYFLQKILGNFVIHNDSESNNIMRNSIAIEHVIKKNSFNKKITKKSIYRNWVNTGKNFHLNSNKKNAFTSYLNAILINKFKITSYSLIFLLFIPQKIFLKIYYFFKK